MRFIRRVGLLAALILSFIAFVAGQDVRAQGFTVAGTWEGYYYYNDGRTKVDFVMNLQLSGGRCTGRTSEPNTFGNKSSPDLYADISCSSAGVGPGRVFQFRKQYDGTGGVSHGVEYSGVVSDDGNIVTGQWRIGRDTGQFSMTRARR